MSFLFMSCLFKKRGFVFWELERGLREESFEPEEGKIGRLCFEMGRDRRLLLVLGQWRISLTNHITGKLGKISVDGQSGKWLSTA
jgi:hypothetical protein